MSQIRKSLTYANVMSSIAVFLMLGGATAFAATKIGANELKANSVKTGKIVKEAVTAGKIKKNAVTESKIADGAVTTNKIANDAVTGDKVKESSLSEVPLAANANKLGGQSSSAFQGSIRWALVAADGSIVRQSGGITTSGSGGIYEVNFGSNVSQGTIISNEIDNGTSGGSVAVMSCLDSGKAGFGTCVAAGNPNVVKIVTTDAGASAVSAQPFYVSVTG